MNEDLTPRSSAHVVSQGYSNLEHRIAIIYTSPQPVQSLQPDALQIHVSSYEREPTSTEYGSFLEPLLHHFSFLPEPQRSRNARASLQNV